jgi:hypothetical protein
MEMTAFWDITLMVEAVRTSETSTYLLQRDYTALYPRKLSSSFMTIVNLCTSGLSPFVLWQHVTC